MIIDSPIISGSYAATGSLNQTGNVVITGSLTVTGTINGSITGSITTASYALNAEALDGLDSTSFTTTSSFTAYTSSTDASILSNTQNIVVLNASASSLDSRVTKTEATASSLTTASSSFSTRVTSNENNISSLQSASGSFSTRTTNLETASGSFSTRVSSNESNISSLQTASGSFSTRVTSNENNISALQTASGSFSTRVTSAEGSVSSLNSKSGSYATTGSNAFNGSQTITGSLTTTGTITAQTLNVQQVTSSIVFSSGSNIFGNSVSNTQQFTGSLQVSGSTSYILGSVGIGTTSPGTNLQVNGGSDTNIRVVSSAGGYAAIQFGDTSDTVRGAISFNSTDNTISVRGYNNEDRLLITSGGNVGIGTTSPAGILEVVGSGAVISRFNSTATNGGVISFQRSGTAILDIGTGLGLLGVGTNNDTAIYSTATMYLGANGTQFVTLRSGNVGIGTTSPGVKLDILGGQARISGSTNEQLVLDYATSVGGFTWQSFRINGTNKYRLVGNVDNSFGIYNDTLSAYALTIASTSAATFANALQVAGQQAAANYGGTGLNFDFTSGNIGRIASVKTTSGGSQLQFFVYNTSGTDVNALQIISTGNVGIGTTNPVQKLDVAGKIRLTDDLQLISANPTIVWGSGTLRFYDNTNAAVRMTIDTNGNLGIGTTSPISQLEVRAPNTGATTNYASKNIIANSPLVGGYTGAPIVSMLAMYDGTIHAADIGYLYDATGYGLVFSVNNDTSGDPAEAMRINRSGNVGIGTTDPNYKLRVEGTLYSLGAARFNGVTFSDSRLAVGVAGGDQTYASVFVGGALTSGTNQYALLLDPQLAGSGDNYGLFANARIKANTAVNNAFGVYIPSAEKLSGATITNNYALYIANQTSGATLNYSIYSSGGLNYFGGNVGIGTTSPISGYLLDVRGNGWFGGGLKVGSASGANGNLTVRGTGTSSSTFSFEAANSNGNSRFLVRDDGESTFYNSSDGVSMRVASGGNIGIGTTSPVVKLHVVENGLFTNGGTDSGQSYVGTTPILTVTTDGDGTASSVYASNAVFKVGIGGASTGNVTTEWFRVNLNGRVGIGTTTINDKLEVRGADNGITISSIVANRPALSFVNGTTNVLRLSANANYGAIGDGTSADRYMIFRGGNVGIGTTSPSINLQVGGTNNNAVGSSTFWNFNFIGQEITNFSNTTGTVAGLTLIGGSGRASVSAIANILESTSLGSLGFFTGGSGIGGGTVPERMRITSGGRVGIQNTSPQGLLEVGIVSTNSTYGGYFFSTFTIPVDTWTTVFTAPNNTWAAITEFTWTSAADFNRSGAAYMRWAYEAGGATLGVVYTLFNNSQNSTATFRNNGGQIQVNITGGAANYYVQVRIQGSQAA